MTDEQNTTEGPVDETSGNSDEPITEGSDAEDYLTQLEEERTSRTELEEANAELSAQLAEALRERDDFKAEAEKHRPTADVRRFHMATPEDVYARFGKDQIADLAQLERVKQNRERSKNGHFPLPQLEGAELEKAINATIADLLGDTARAQPPIEGPLNRVLKMVDREGNLRQIPYEPQINNMAGSLADGYERYRQKGFKMPDPMLCATADCYEDSRINAAGEFEFKGYCSQDHMDRTERLNTQTQVPGVTNRNVLSGV